MFSVDGSSALWTPNDVHKEVLSVQDSLAMRKDLFTLRGHWEVKVQKWMSASIFSLHLGQLQREVARFIRNIEFMEKSELGTLVEKEHWQRYSRSSESLYNYGVHIGY